MRKLNVFLIGQDDQFTEVGGANQAPKWEFETNPVLEALFVERKTMTGKKNENYFLYRFIHRHTKSEYVVFGTKVLDDRFSKIVPNSLVRVTYLGKDKDKGYKKFTVGVDLNFKFNPAEWQATDFKTVGGDEEGANRTNNHGNTSGPAVNTNSNSQQIEDDLPF